MGGSRIVIGCGYLGARVAKRWLDAGHRVFATTRRPEKARDLRESGIEPVVWDPGSSTDLLPEVQVALYAVGFDRSPGSSRDAVYADGLERAARSLERSPAARFLYSSSTGVYGDAGGDWVDEATSPNPADDGGRACRRAEERLLDLRPTDSVVLRLAGLYGPGRLIGAQRLLDGATVSGNPDAYLNLIHVDDAAGAVDCLVELPAGELPSIVNVADGQPAPRSDFYGYMASRIGAPEPTFDPGSAARHRGDRRVSAELLIGRIGFRPRFPEYRAGIDAILASGG